MLTVIFVLLQNAPPLRCAELLLLAESAISHASESSRWLASDGPLCGDMTIAYFQPRAVLERMSASDSFRLPSTPLNALPHNLERDARIYYLNIDLRRSVQQSQIKIIGGELNV